MFDDNKFFNRYESQQTKPNSLLYNKNNNYTIAKTSCALETMASCPTLAN